MLTASQSREWQDAALWVARRGGNGEEGERLPVMLNAAVVAEILACPDEFRAEVRLAHYALRGGMDHVLGSV